MFRHPIKSHGREMIDAVTLIAGQTMPWDRTWAVTHEASKFPAGGQDWMRCSNFMITARTPGLAGIWARLDTARRQVTLTHADLDKITFAPDAPGASARFVEWVRPLCPEDRARPTGLVSAQNRGMTDSDYPTVSVMNMASHKAVADAPGGPDERARWRGNIWLGGAAPWVEFGWVGRHIRIGRAVLRVTEPIRRCMATAANPVTGLRDRDTLAVLNDHFGHQDFGVYAEVIEGGDVRQGDAAVLA